MALPFHLLVPLTSGAVYAVAALFLKRSTEGGAGPWRTAFITNWVQAIVFAPFWLLGGEPFAWDHFLHAAIAAVAFFIGQIFTFLALSRGDVSVTTPVLGTKVIFVALLTVLLVGEPIRPSWWSAAVLTASATALLGGAKRGAPRNQAAAASLLYAFPAALAFATTDVLQQKWARAWGFGHFAPVMFFVVALLSCALVPFFHGPLRELSPSTWRALLPGSVLLSMQASGVAYSIIAFGGATVVNILYNTRAIWSVMLVWTIGHWFSNTERMQGSGVMGQRLCGAMVLLAAIVLAVRG
ncbi:EamA family transporter [Verrucomicrobiota bacterium sgz303538]